MSLKKVQNLHCFYRFQALYFYNLAGASIDPKTLQHVAKVCANVDLSEHVVDVIFTIFDEDGDGALSNKEFVAVMKNKLKRNFFLTFISCSSHVNNHS